MDLSDAVYIAAIPHHGAPIQALVVYCSQCDMQHPAEDFVENYLGITAFDRLVIPGGPWVLCGDRSRAPAYWDIGACQAKFLIANHDLPEVVLIGHDYCGWYRHLYGKDLSLEALALRQMQDLRRCVSPVQNLPLVGPMPVRAYFSRIVEHGKCAFFPVV